MIFQINEYVILNIIAAGLVSLAGFFTAINAYRKNSEFIGNKLLTLSMSLIGLYGIFVILEQATTVELVINIFGRFEYIALIYAVYFLYLTMNTIIKSSKWVEKNWKIWILFVGITIFVITLFVWEDAFDFIITDRSDIYLHPIMMIVFSVYIAFTLFYSIFVTYFNGAKQTTGEIRRKMMQASFGFFMGIMSLFVELANTFIPELDWLDFFFFVCLAIAMFFVGLGFSRTNKE